MIINNGDGMLVLFGVFMVMVIVAFCVVGLLVHISIKRKKNNLFQEGEFSMSFRDFWERLWGAEIIYVLSKKDVVFTLSKDRHECLIELIKEVGVKNMRKGKRDGFVIDRFTVRAD